MPIRVSVTAFTPEGLDRAKAKLEAATARHTPENRAEWLRRLGITDAAA